MACFYHNSLFVSNLGDCRAVLSRTGGMTLDLSVDQKPGNPKEIARIVERNGFVTRGRVLGVLGVARAFGNIRLKMGKGGASVSVSPEIMRHNLVEGDDLLILACDGLWDVLTSAEAASFVNNSLKAFGDLNRIAQNLCDHVRIYS